MVAKGLFKFSRHFISTVDAHLFAYINWVCYPSQVSLGCEQPFGRAGNWGEGKAKRPADKHLGPPFHGTRCASDPHASSYWREH